MRVFVDLHIHSALSPCAENEMTPNNIVNMAWLKGLDAIAITDHNTVENCEAVMECAKEKGILAIPGMEVETCEEVHIVCLFPDMEAAREMQKIVWSALPDIKNRSDIFGDQWIMDSCDNITGQIERLLVTASNIGVDEVFQIVARLGGAALPAHIDRASYSMLSNLGIIPDGLDIHYVELSKKCDADAFFKCHKTLAEYKYIKSSDAHSLGDILEQETCFDIDELNACSMIKILK